MGLKDYAKNKAKSKVKMVIMSALKPVLIKVAIIAGIVALVLIFLASAWGIINQTIVTETSKTVRNSGDEPAVVIDSDSRQYNLDTEFAERVNKLLENKSINAESKGLTEELVTKMYEAEIFTSYPDLRERSKIGTKITGDELQGCIQFIRNYEDGTEQLLEYMDFSEFQRRLAELGRELPDEEGNTVSVGIVTAQSEVERKYNELKKYFTLDSEYNVIIPTISTTTINVDYSEYAEKENNTDTYEYIYTVNYQKINYQSQVKKYAMPIEFPLSLLVITENPGFCEEILELVEDSKIVIEIHDNQTTTTTVQKYDYDGYFNIHKKVNYTVDVEVPDEEQEDTEQEEIEPDDPNQGNDEQEDEETITPPNVVKPGGKPNKPNTGYTPELMYYTDNTDLKYEFLSQIKIVKTAITQRHSSSTMSSNDKLLKVKNIDNTPFKTTTEISKQSDIALCIVEARTWLLDLEVTYKKDVNTTSTTESNPLPDEETYTKVNDYHNFLADFEMTLEPGAYNIKTDASSYIEEKKVNQENKTTTTVVDIVYTKESSNIEEKEERFLSLLAVNPLTGEYDKEDRSKNTKIIKYKKATGRTASPVDSILTSKEMLFDLLSVNEESQSLEETMRYLLYIYTGKSYGVTTLDFSIYEPTEFKEVSFTTSFNKFKQYLHSWEGCTSLSADGTMYKIELDGGGNPTVGYGVDVNANKPDIERYGYSTNVGDYIPKEFVDALEDTIIARNIETVETKTASLNLTQYQIYALVSRAYNCGDDGAFQVRNGKTFVQAYNAYWNEETDIEYKVPENSSMYEHRLYTEYMSEPTTSKGNYLQGLKNRRESEWILFKTGYFDRINEYCSELGGSAGAILESAEAIHYYMEQNKYSYCIIGSEKNTHLGECGLDATFEESKTNHRLTCCATYVSWVLRDAGLINVTHHSSNGLANYLISLGYSKVSYSEIEAGDIIFMRTDSKDIGHTQIYAGDGQWYNAGSVNAIQRESPYTGTVSSSAVVYVLRAP